MKSINIRIISILLIVFGSVMLITGLLMGGKTSAYFSNGKLKIRGEGERQQETILLDEFDQVKVNLNYSNFEIIKGVEYKLEIDTWNDYGAIQYFYDEHNKLNIKQEKASVMNFISFGFEMGFTNSKKDSTVKLYIPNEIQLVDVDITIDDGNFICDELELNKFWINIKYSNMNLSNIMAEDVRLIIKDGKCEANEIVTNNLYYENNYGNINARLIDVKEDAEFKVNDGNIVIDYYTVKNSIMVNKYGNIDIKHLLGSNTDFNLVDGKLTITKLDGDRIKIFNSYGKVNIDNGLITSNTNITGNDSSINIKGTLLGISEINTKYGDIDLDIDKPEEEYSYEMECKYGSTRINGVKKDNIERIADTGNKLILKTNNGDIDVDFN